MPPLRVALAVVAVSLTVGAGSAAASPGAYRVLVINADSTPAANLRAQIAAQPDVSQVDYFNGANAVVPSAQLASDDLVVSMSNVDYFDGTTYGNELADFVDAGGVVFELAYNSWDDSFMGTFAQPQGRWVSGAFPPYLAGNDDNIASTLGVFDAANPLMQGVTALNSFDNTTPTLAPGATRVARWADGREGVAYKGRVAASSANLDDENTPWSGDWAKLITNAVHWLGRHTLSVTKTGTGAGTVSSAPTGIKCGTTCAGNFVYPATVTLTAAAADANSKFTAWGGVCSGRAVTCAVPMDVAKSVSATFTKVGGRASFKFGSSTVAINLRTGLGSTLVSCANLATDHCRFSLRVNDAGSSKAAKRIRVGIARGTVKGRRTGALNFRLSRRGRARLHNATAHKLKVRLIGSSRNRANQGVRVNKTLTLKGSVKKR
jgi:hypothetical protein